ncbi:GtrA family protein [Candidatus Saccharibacteria bacterium]|nr:GtrA family protein [Candidatus Saccharibacteria bacterium]
MTVNSFSKHRELFLFGVIGVLGYIVDVTITKLGESMFGVYGARIPAFVAAATVTWAMNRTFTFSQKQKVHSSLLREYLHYLSLMIVGLTFNYVVYVVSVTLLAKHSYTIYASVALGSLAGMTVNFVNSKKYLYKQ